MRLLLDTNVFLEVILAQARAADAKNVIANQAGHGLHVTDFSMHSIGLLFVRQKRHADFERFMDDLVANVRPLMVGVPLADLGMVSETAAKHKLDFDDAYQYAASELAGLEIVSFDGDFDGTPKGRIPPGDKRLFAKPAGQP
jgi:hypothetical protein